MAQRKSFGRGNIRVYILPEGMTRLNSNSPKRMVSKKRKPKRKGTYMKKSSLLRMLGLD